MRGRRLIANCLLLCLPAALLCIAGVYFLREIAPRIIRNQRTEITQAYRQTAKKILTMDERRLDYCAPRERKGWRVIGRIEGVRWGVSDRNRVKLVWIEREGMVRGVLVPPVDEMDYERLFFIGVPLILGVLVFMTFSCLRFLVRDAKMRDDFLAAAAHDLSTPLVGMRYLIGRDEQTVRTLNERMIHIVENIRDFVKGGGRARKPTPTTFVFEKAYHEAYELFRADYRDQFDGKDVAFDDGGTEHTVWADETMVVQILWNLLGNDLKYAAPHGRVSATVTTQGKRVVFSLVDEGPGMTVFQRWRAFNRYYRVRSVLTMGKGGFGIGLCTAREFARSMGGDLVVRPNAPRGCRFVLTLPAAEGHYGIICANSR